MAHPQTHLLSSTALQMPFIPALYPLQIPWTLISPLANLDVLNNALISLNPSGNSNKSILELPRPTPVYPQDYFIRLQALNQLRCALAGGFSLADIGQEKPLDLSLQPDRMQSVIQHTPNLPTCQQPRIHSALLSSGKANKRARNAGQLPLKSADFALRSPSPSNTSSSNGSSSSQVSQKSPTTGTSRLSYPREFKLMVLEHYHTTNQQNKYRTCKQFHITKSMLNGWLLKAEHIRRSRPGALKSGRSGRRPQFPNIEQQLYRLYIHEVALHANTDSGDCRKVTNKWIRETARRLAAEQCNADELKQGMCQFSERWLTNFKKRYRIQAASAKEKKPV
ncbi:tc5 transposase DNA-binding domain-containing protein [Ditylenchus destructor]|uniref:Tc5 transposase DNA-binding domain-containing protein n=1 Tax=Ditylenchus destructor TaxID=166010 RepID=A0AAD4RB32_9BILA|nr:tc5 transposase DNA-binding domain-containing protein [Ditylenchus destructor]